MRTFHPFILATLAVVLISVPELWAQQQTPQEPEKPLDQATQPIPAIRSPLASAADNENEDLTGEAQNLTPDTRSLAGVQELTVGGPAIVHSYWQPHFDFTSTIDSNPVGTTTQQQQGGGWSSWSSILAGVNVRRISGASDFTLNYTGGGTLSNGGSYGNGVIQELALVEKLKFRRETLTIIDQMNYLPEAAFGYSSFGTGQLPPGVGVQLQPGFGPSQSILTPQGQSIINVFATELDTLVSPRSTITLVGSYSLLHYFDNNLLNTDSYTFQGGYNYQWTRKDTVAAFYSFNAFRYGGATGQSINAHSVQVSYARRVTGRLAFQIAAGPQFAIEQIPVSGISGSTGGTGAVATGSTTQHYWTLTTSLQYQMHAANLALNYYHGLSGGSGVLGGSVTDTLTSTATRQLSRTLSANLNVGYSRNSGVVVGTAMPSNQVYDYWFFGGGLSHPWGRTMTISALYQLQYQTSSAPFCLGGNCQTSYVRNLISFSLGWHKQPIPF